MSSRRKPGSIVPIEMDSSFRWNDDHTKAAKRPFCYLDAVDMDSGLRRNGAMNIDPVKTEALVQAGRFFHQRGWVPATAGNFSFRVDAKTIAVTVSGRHKGELTADDFMRVDLHGRALDEGKKSSAETLLHCQIFRHFSKVGAVFHVHSPASTALSRRCDNLRLENYELLKILDGIETHETAVDVPVFENDQDIARLAGVVEAHMSAGAARHGYLIRGHGLYAWGDTIPQARHRVEALEFLFECERLA